MSADKDEGMNVGNNNLGDKSDSTSSSSSSCSDSSCSNRRCASRKRKRCEKRRRRSGGKRRRTNDVDNTMQQLTKQVSDLQQLLLNQQHTSILPTTYGCNDNYEEGLEPSVDLNVSGELYDVDNRDETDPTLPKIEFSIHTQLKDPTVPVTTNVHLDLLKKLQHFDSEEWNSVRYADVQKNYCSKPGFIELECNDEVKPFEKCQNLLVTEKSLAAISHALIIQNEALQKGFEDLIKWANTDSNILTSKSLYDKINEIFMAGTFQKPALDALQLVCGRRADLIEQRRDAILACVKDKFIRGTLRKIPPSTQYLFENNAFSEALKNNGTVNKIFGNKPGFSAQEKRSQISTMKTTHSGINNNYSYGNNSNFYDWQHWQRVPSFPPPHGVRPFVNNNYPLQGYTNNFFRPQYSYQARNQTKLGPFSKSDQKRYATNPPSGQTLQGGAVRMQKSATRVVTRK